jgi:prophage CP4-57 regulatory protein alpA
LTSYPAAQSGGYSFACRRRNTTENRNQSFKEFKNMEAATEKFGSDRALRAKQVSEKVGLCVSAIWAKTSPKNARYDATFPKPFKVAANATVWLESELDAWLSAKAESRIDGKQGATA